MSTATAEQLEVKTTPEPTPEQVKAEQMAASILRPGVVKEGVTIVPPLAKKEPVKEEPKTEAKAPVVPDKPLSDKEINLGELRKAREAAEATLKEREAELAKAREEFETFKKNPIPKEFEEKLTTAEKRAQEFQRELQAAALGRDPDFQKRFNVPIQQNLDIISSVLVNNGVDKAEVAQMINQWDENRMAETADGLPPAARLKVTAAMMEAIRLDNQKQQEIQHADQTFAEMQKQRQQAQEQSQQEHLKSLQKDRDFVLAKFGENEIFKADEEVRKQTQEMLDSVIGVNGNKMPASNVLTILGSTFLAAKQLEKTIAEKTEMASKLEAAEKKIADQEEFIKSVQSGIPVPNPTSGAPAGGDVNALVNSILKPRVRA